MNILILALVLTFVIPYVLEPEVRLFDEGMEDFYE